MKPSVLFLCRYAAVYGGNFIPSLMALEKKLSQRGLVCVYCFPPEAEERYWFGQLREMGRQVVTMDFSQGFGDYHSALRKLCKQYSVTTIYTHFTDDVYTGLFSWMHGGIKAFIHMHSDFTGGKKASLLGRLKRFVVYHVLLGRVKFISVSRDLAAISPNQITWVPNALATERIPCPHTGREALRSALGVAEHETLIEIYGWSPYIKGVDIGVNAVKQLNQTLGVPAKLAIVCGHETVPEKMQDWIRAHTDCQGNEEFLVYLPPQEDVFAFHEAADLLLSASRSEGFSYSLLEMLSLGKGCVFSDIPGTIWADAYDIAYRFPSENAGECALALKQAIEACPLPHPGIAQTIREQFSMDKWTDTIADLLTR